MKRLAFFTSLPVLLLSSACSTSDTSSAAACQSPTDKASTLALRAADPESDSDVVLDSNPLHWAAVDADAVASVDLFTPVLGPPVAADDPIVVRLNGWVDKIDELVRVRWDRAKHTPFPAPKPRLQVMPSASFTNAWALQLALATQLPTGDSTIVRVATNKGSVVPTGIGSLLPAPSGWASRDDVASLWRSVQPSLPLDDQQGRWTRSCSRDDPNDGIGLNVTASIVKVTTPLIAALDEGGVLFTLAHELAHYYRAHGSARDQELAFWFERGEQTPGRPAPSPRADELAKAIAAIESGEGTTSQELADLVRANGVGYYDQEQEADAIAQDTLVRLGFSTDEILEFVVTTHARYEQSVAGWLTADKGLRAGECAAGVKSGFVDANGTPITVPLAAISGLGTTSHPSMCYRIFQLWRDARTRHDLAASTQSTHAPFESGWDDVQAHARQLSH